MTDRIDQARDSARPTDAEDALPPPEQHARQYKAVRDAHETELIEDYVELIGDLLDHGGEARATDIAARMGVRQATVARMIRRLNELGFVNNEPYRSIFLYRPGSGNGQPLPAAPCGCSALPAFPGRTTTPRPGLTPRAWSTT